MEDEIAKYRLAQRPGLRSRSPSRASPSSNASSINLPSLPGSSNGTEMNERPNINSSLLMERLREKRAETLQVAKHRRGSGSTERSRFGSSPIGSSFSGKFGEQRPSAASEKMGTLGAKEMEEVVSKLHKQNFDLKLELYHRREKQEALEKKNVDLEEDIVNLKSRLEQDRELQSINERLIIELELRDQALEEAVAIICEREAQIQLMEEENSLVSAYNMEYSIVPQPSSPPQLDRTPDRSRFERPKLQARTLKYQPSFLTDQSRSTEALRTLFGANEADIHELPFLPEDTYDTDAEEDPRSHSPQLSVLSESSFMSVYGVDQSVLTMQQDKQVETPGNSHVSKSSPALPRRGRDQYLSLDHVASSPIRRIDGVKNRIEHSLRNTKGMSVSTSSKAESETSRKSSSKSMPDKLTYTEFLRDRMPPTPDTMSTNTLRFQQQSYDTLSKSADSEDDQISATGRQPGLMPPPPRPSTETLNVHKQNYPSSSTGRPRTAGETATDSRRWTSDIQVGHGRTESVASDPWLASAIESGNQKPRREPPRLFDFGLTDEWSRSSPTQSAVRDLMFNNDHVSSHKSGRSLPPLPNQRGTTSMSSRSEEEVLRKAGQVNVKDCQTPSSPRQRSKPLVKNDRRPPPSASSTSNTPNSNIANMGSTPRSNVTTPTPSLGQPVKRSGSLKRFLGSLNRSETVPDITLAPQDQSPSPAKSSITDRQRKNIRKNSISIKLPFPREVATDDAGNPSAPAPRYADDHPGLSATPPAIKDNRGLGAAYRHMGGGGRQVSSPVVSPSRYMNERQGDGRPSTAGGELGTKLALSRSYEEDGRGLGSDGTNDEGEGGGGGEGREGEKGDAGRMVKLKGVVWKKLGRKG